MPITQIQRGPTAGQAFGQGVQSSLVPYLQQLGQRAMIQKSLEQVSQLGQNPNATPFDLVKALVGGTAGLPGAERFVGPLFQALQPLLAGNRLKNTPQPEFGGFTPSTGISQGTGQQIPNQPSQTQQQNAAISPITQENVNTNLPQPGFTPDLFKGTLDPTELGLGPIPSQYTPEQIQKARQQDLAAGFSESPQANAMEKHNENARAQTADLVKAAQSHSAIAEARAKRQADFRDVLQNELGIKDPADLSVAETIAERPEYRKIDNDKIRASRVAEELKKYQAGKDEFTRAANRPNPIVLHHRYKQSLDTLGNKARNLIDYGQRDKANQILAENGWSESEISKILNPLSSQIQSGIKGLPDFSRSLASGGGSQTGMGAKKESEKNKNIEKTWSTFLSKNIHQGHFDPKKPDVFKPGTSLVLLRNEALKKGMGGVVFDRILNELIDSEKVKLDPDQQKELQFMSQSPSRVWSIYELITGP